MQSQIRSLINNLISVSGLTDDYVREDRLDSAMQSLLVQLANDSQGTLAQLKALLADFEKWGMQDIREQEITEMTDKLNTEIQALEDINGKIRETTIQLEKLLQKFFAEVKSGERDSSIRSFVSISSVSSSSSDHAWAQLRQELQGIGISSRLLEQNRDMIIKTLQKVFDQEPALMSIQIVNNGSRLDRLRSYVTGSSKGLTLASASGHVDEVRTLLRKGAHVDVQNGRGETAPGLAIMNGHTEVAGLLLSFYADVNKASKEGFTPLQLGVQNARLDVIQLLLEHGANVNQKSRRNLPLVMAVHEREYRGLEH
ncbi:MAG: hypothetical protein Q9193_005480 [Seirophora villosa]